jgi:hypothetical protein
MRKGTMILSGQAGRQIGGFEAALKPLNLPRPKQTESKGDFISKRKLVVKKPMMRKLVVKMSLQKIRIMSGHLTHRSGVGSRSGNSGAKRKERQGVRGRRKRGFGLLALLRKRARIGHLPNSL